VRALWLSCHLPYPPISGGRLRELELLRRIARHVDVHVIAVSKDPAHDREHLDGLRAVADLAEVELHDAQPDEAAPCTIVGRHASPSATGAVAAALGQGEVDLVHVEGFYLAQHLPPDPTVPTVLVDQNVEFELWRQRADGAAGSGDDLVGSHWRREALRCRAAEMAAWRQATQCVTVTEDDAEVIRRVAPDVPVAVVPDGADHLPPHPARPLRCQREVAAEPRLMYLGNYAYEPNADAARFLVDEVLPLVRAAWPTAGLSLVGNAPPDWLRARAEADPRLEVTGLVPDVAAHLAACDVMVLPLRIGGGVKVKVLEGLAAGVPVVTTPAGAQGLPRGQGAPLVVDVDAGELARAVVRVLGEPSLRRSLAAAARHVAALLPTWDDAAAALLDVYDLTHTTARARSA
jgi:polysaccharide biosynthesis protein PslH